MDQYSHTWYRPGDWKLPGWWTEMPPGRSGKLTHSQQTDFYNGAFVRNVLGHTGGMTRPPRR
jgi:hypothetical protein